PGQATPQATPYPAAQKMVQQAVQPIARQALPGSSALAAAANSGAVQEALTRTLTTVAGAASAAANAFGTLADWTTVYYYSSDEATQSPSAGRAPAPLEPLFPPTSPAGDSSFFSMLGVGQAGPGGGLVLLLLGVLAPGVVLPRRE